jgi:signal transduction histidine kinase
MIEVTGGAVASLGGVRELSACAQSLAGVLEKDSGEIGILTELPHLVWWKDLGGRYLGSNRAYTRARGLPETADLVGCLEDDLSLDDAFTTTLPELERSVIASGVPVTGVQSLFRRGPGDGDSDGAGTGLKILLTVVPLRTAEGGVYGVIGVGADVSGLSDIDRKVSQASRLESIGRLAANIAHQINTPIRYLTDNTRFVADGVAEALTALQAVQSLAMSQTVEPAETCLDEIRKVIVETDVDFLDAELPSVLLQSLEELSQVAQIVSELTGFSRPEGEMTLTDLNHAVDSAVNLTLPEWRAIADLRLDLGRDVGEIPGYEGELRQVLLNLITNAAQAITTRRRKQPQAPLGLIEVSTRRFDDGVRIAVRDNGCGMTPATRARIFDPFFTTKPLGQAIGQGLSFAYTTVVIRHHGSIDVASRLGEGSTFTVTLPARQ